MSLDVIYGGVFGILAVVIGGFITYILSFSRDRRLKREEQKILNSALVSDLEAIKSGFELSESYLPRFPSKEIFIFKGGYLEYPSTFLVNLQELSIILNRIEDINKEDHAFNVATASAGNPNLEYSNHGSLSERAKLIDKANELILQLVQDLSGNA